MSSYSAKVLSLSPDGYWRFGESSGTTAADASGNGRNGTYTPNLGTILYGQSGLVAADPAATSVHFSGGPYVQVATDSVINTTGSWTILGWTFYDTSGGGNILATFASTSSLNTLLNGWDVGTNGSGKLTINAPQLASSPFIYSGAAFATATAYFLAVVYDATNHLILAYINGSQVASLSAPNAVSATTFGLRMGNNQPSDYLLGREQDMAYWARVLSPTDILGIFQSGSTPPYQPPVAIIAGTQVNVEAGSLSVKAEVGQRGQGSMRVWSALGTFWSYGTAVQVKDAAGAVAYRGYITKDKATKSGARQGTGYLEHDLTLMDNAYRADKRVVTASYLNATAGFIVNDLVTNVLAAEGVTIASSVATGVNIPEVSWVLKPVSQALDWLASQCGFWWTIDLNGVLWFQPYSGIPASTSIDGTTVSADDTLSVTYGNDQYVNRQYAKGGYDKTPLRSETFAGDGTRRSFSLAYQVAELQSITLNGVVQSTGTKSVDSGKQWYYAVGDAVIGQDPSIGGTLGSGDRLTVNYKGRFPVVALATNPTLIAAQQAREGGGTGFVEAVHDDNKIYSLQGLLAIATALLNKYGSELILLEYQTRTPNGLQPGQSVSVSLSDFAISNHTFLVMGVEITDSVDDFNLWYHISAVGSPATAAQWQAYYQRLMRQRPDPDLEVVSNLVTVAVVSGALECNAVLSVAAQVVAPAGSDALISNSVLT